ncbi:hypothetical protein [Bacillus sp. REN16]|uniref:hypothetical protein n=1 Tax=Bacillus sp. REN16 TaxID=2887296 RepID=UPI001E47FAB5|nr:hypothetical protein [Bacillus sp. REN16]MCC3359624.1 hypothetical protein [Bacillus sp. REN16]
MDNLLYFPYISIPKTPWLYKSLLYWDTVDTITPEHYLRRPQLFEGTYMTELLEAELVKPVLPMNYIHDIPNFKEDFISYVDNNYVPKKDLYKRKDGNLVYATRIHFEKMDELGFELVERELAYRRGRWFFMHRSVANDFMFYLASLIGNIRASQPITDSAIQLKTRMPVGNQEQKTFINREGWRRTVLNHAFPTPIEITTVRELYEFKHKHETQLKNFRKYIERELINIDSTPVHLREEMLQNLLLDIEDEKQSITEKMKGKWNVTDMATIIQMTVNAGTITNAIQTGTNLAIGTASISLLGTIYSALKKVGKNEEDILNNPLAYAFIADKRWGGNKRCHKSKFLGHSDAPERFALMK